MPRVSPLVSLIALGAALAVASPASSELSRIDSLGTGPAPITPVVPAPVFVDTTDPAVPGAQQTLVDVQNVMFWSRFQKGEHDGWRYVLFPDGSATVIRDWDGPEQRFTLACQSGVACTIITPDNETLVIPAVGAPRPELTDFADGKAASVYLAEWILAGTGTPQPEPEPEPEEPAPPAPEGAETSPASGSESLLGTEADLTETALPDGTQEIGDLQPEPAPEETAPTDTAPLPIEQVCPELPGDVPNICGEPEPRTDTVRQEPTVIPTRPAPQNVVMPAPQEEPQLTFADRLRLKCYATASMNLNYSGSGPGKPRATIGCGGRITDRLSFQLSLVDYLFSEQQNPWDPDFTYAFRYKVNDNPYPELRQLPGSLRWAKRRRKPSGFPFGREPSRQLQTADR